MSDLFVWVEVFLVIGGPLIGMLGLMWYKGAKLLNFFDVQTNPEPRFWVAMTGFAMMAAGIGLLYLTGESK